MKTYKTLLISSLLLVAAGAFAQTWTGATGDNSWATTGNWNPAGTPTAPTFGAAITAGSTTLNNNLAANTSLAGLTFSVGALPFTLNGAIIDTTGGISDYSTSTETINLGIVLASASHSLYAPMGGTLVIGGVIDDGGLGYGITTTGPGTVSLTASNTFGSVTSAATAVNNGTLELDFNTLATASSGTDSNNIIEPNCTLSLGGGTLLVNGSSTLLNSQTFTGTTVASGVSGVTVAENGGSANATVNLGPLTISKGASVVFNGPATIGAGNVAVNATGTITTTTGNEANGYGILATGDNNNAYATVGLYEWAAATGSSPYTINGGSQVPSFYTIPANNATINGGYNYDIATQQTPALGGTANVRNSSGTAYNYSVRFNTGIAPYITCKSGTYMETGGVLITPNMGIINAGLDIMRCDSTTVQFVQNNTLGVFCLGLTGGAADAPFFGNAGGTPTESVVKSGPGTWFLNPGAPMNIVFNYTNSSGVLATSSSGTYNSTQEASSTQAGFFFNGGVTVINYPGVLGEATTANLSTTAGGLGTVNLNGGTLMAGYTTVNAGSVNLIDPNAASASRSVFLGANGGGLAAQGATSTHGATTFTVGGVIAGATGTGPLCIGVPASSANGGNEGLVPGTGSVGSYVTANPAFYATGTVILTGANTYTGGTMLYSGILNAASASLGLPLSFGGGTYQWTSASPDISTQPVTLNAGTATLDVNGYNLSLANGIGNSGSGALLVASTGSSGGTLTLNGAGTYTGGTTISNGAILVVANTTGSATGTGPVTVDNTALLEGTGTIGGAVTDLAGGVIEPAVSGVGTLTVGSLTLNANSICDIQFTSTPANSEIVVTTLGGLSLNGGIFNLYAGGTTPFTTAGTYNLIAYTGSIGGAGLDTTWTTASEANTHVGNPQVGYLYSFSDPVLGGYLTVTIAPDLSAVIADWIDNAPGGDWSSTANWSPARVPHSPGDAATLGASTSLRTITLDQNETVGELQMTNAHSFVIAGTSTLTIDNSGSPATIAVTGGSQNAIQTPVSLNSPTTINVGSGDSLAMSGSISNETASETVTVSGPGTLALSGINSYGPGSGQFGTYLAGGMLQVGSASALGTSDLSVTGSSTLQAGASLSLNNNIDIASGMKATVDTQANSLGLTGTISDSGSLAVTNSAGSGTGTLILSGANSYAGSTTINGGVVVSIAADSGLGTAPVAAALNSIVLNGGDLKVTGSSVTLNANRGIGIGTSAAESAVTALIDETGSGLIVAPNIAGNATVNNLTVNGSGGSGTVELTGANTFNGTTIISNGTLDVGNSLALQDSTLYYNGQGGSLTFDGTAGIVAATFGGLQGGQSLALVNTTNGPVALTVGGNNSSTVYSGNLTDSGLGGALIKNGTSTLTLTGSDSYMGTTTVNTGTLEIPAGGQLNVGVLNGQGYLVDGGALSNGPATVSSLGNAINAFLQTAGTVNVGEVTWPNNDNTLIEITGGAFSCQNLYMERAYNYGTTLPTATAPISATTNAGVWINSTNTASPAQVYLGQLTIGATNANSSSSLRMDAGSLTVTNEVLLGNIVNTRLCIMQINGGNFTNLDTNNGITMCVNNVSTAYSTTYANNAELYLAGGNTYANIINFGNTADTVGGDAFVIVTNASLYIGSGGINMSNTAGMTPSLFLEKGILGATANWSSAVAGDGSSWGFSLGAVAGDTFTIQAASPANVPYNISLNGSIYGVGNLVKTGGGTLALSGANNWTGTTTVSAGTLALSGNDSTTGLLAGTPTINIIAPGVLDVTGLSDQTLHLSDPYVNQGLAQALTGNGTVNGSVLLENGGYGGSGAAASLAPGTTPTSFGNLTITGNLTNTSAIILKVDHPPTGATNDMVTALTLTNFADSAESSVVPTLTVNNPTYDLQTGDTFKLFNITGGGYAYIANNLTITLPTTSPVTSTSYTWDTSQLAVNGTIKLTHGVAPSIPITPTNIVFGLSGRTLNISWPASYLGWSLQSNSINISVPADWFTVPGSSAVTSESITIPTTGDVYFRLYYQAP